MNKILIAFILFLAIQTPSLATTYYVETTGGTTTQCTGTTDAAYPGSGSGQACAFIHPSWALGSLGTSGVMAAGDTLIIGPGSYLIGATMPNTSNSSCNNDQDFSYDCVLDDIPSGADSSHKTKIYGKGYDDPTNNTKPILYGVQRASYILQHGSNVDIEFLDITDHSNCIEYGPIDGTVGGDPVQCVRSAAPYGNWAETGIKTNTASNVTWKYLDIHGMGKTGVFAYRSGDMDLDHVNIIANGYVNWDSDGTGDDSYTGTVTYTDSKNEWAGCGEKYPTTTSDYSSATDKHHCWSQSQGGYGDCIGLGDGDPGNWTFVRSSVSYCASDGVDILHGSGTGTVIFYRSKAEGSTGNQLKTNSALTYVENSKIIGNCGFFYGQSFTSTKDSSGSSTSFDYCRASGNAIVFANRTGGQKFYIRNSTILAGGDSAIIIEGSSVGCDGGTLLKLDNDIVYGGRDMSDDTGLWNGSGGNDDTDFFFNAQGSGACATLGIDADSTIVYKTKSIGSDTDCSGGTADQCNVDPQFSGTIKQGCASGAGACSSSDYFQAVNYANQLDIGSGSPARDAADETVTCSQDCSVDYNAYARGASWDIGSLEYGSSAPGGTCGDNTKDPGETCDGTDLDSETCVTQGFASGTLSCAGDCLSFVTSSCVAAGSGVYQRFTGGMRVTGSIRSQ